MPDRQTKHAFDQQEVVHAVVGPLFGANAGGDKTVRATHPHATHDTHPLLLMSPVFCACLPCVLYAVVWLVLSAFSAPHYAGARLCVLPPPVSRQAAQSLLFFFCIVLRLRGMTWA